MSDHEAPELIGPTLAELLGDITQDEMRRQYVAASVAHMRAAIIAAAHAAFSDRLRAALTRDTETVLRAPMNLEPIQHAGYEAARAEGERLIAALEAAAGEGELPS